MLLLRKCGIGGQTVKRSSDFSLDKTYKAIPPDVTFICSFNIPTILEEIEFEKLRNSEGYIDKLRLTYNENPPFTRVFSNPEGAGINTSEKAVFYLDVGTNAEEVYTAVILSLKDANVFSRLASDHAKHNKIQSKDHYSYLKINPISSVAWDDNNVMFITTDESMDQESVFDQVFNPNKEKYFDGSEKFYEFVESSTSDLAFWMDLTSYARNQIHATGKPGEFNEFFLRGVNLFGTAEFSKGSVDLVVNYDLNAILQKFIDQVFKPDYDVNILNNILPEKPSFIANVSFNISGVLNLMLRDIDAKVEARNSLIPYGLTLEDFSKAASGDALFAFYPNADSDKTSTLFILKIEDQNHFDELISIWQQLGKIASEGNDTYVMRTGYIPFLPIESTYEDKLQRMLIKDGYMYVSLDRKVIEYIQSNSSTSIDPAELGIDINNSSDHLLSVYGDNGFKEISAYANRFSIKDYTLNYKENSMLFHFNLQDENTSSLKQLLALN
jgi:hypothetical protein